MRKMTKAAAVLCLLLVLVLNAAAALAADDQPSSSENALDFQYKEFRPGQSFRVYSGPGRHYWVGANSGARALSDEQIRCAGQEGKFLLIQYDISDGVRVGYICIDDISGDASANPLSFDYKLKTIIRQCGFTDDPSSLDNRIGTLRAGERVTYLSRYSNDSDWAYIESTINGDPIRGFVPLDCIQ